MDSYSNLLYDGAKYFDGPPDDLHSKRLAETPRYSRTKAMSNFQSAFGASRKLQQLVGITEPEPYVRPPPVPQDLEQRFFESLREYGLDREPLETLSGAASGKPMMSAAAQFGKTQLENIVEEKESPVRATHQKSGSGGRSGGLSIITPGWQSGCEAMSGAEMTMTEGQQKVSQDMGHAFRLHYEQVSSYTNTENQFTKDAENSAKHDFPHGSSSLADLKKRKPLPRNEELPMISFDDKAFELLPFDHLSGQADARIPSPILFPSPRVEQEESWGFPQTDNDEAVPFGMTTSAGLSDQGIYIAEQVAERPQQLPPPQITIQAPSPGKMPPPTTKKRPATSQDSSPAKARASDATCGLPILDADLEMLWKVKFPGNTYALLSILLPWSLTTRRLYNQIQEPYSFSVNAAFPYHVKPPVYQKLVSVSFYNTSVTPHKEVRFIGPGDCKEMSYNEVDVFSKLSETSDPVDPNCKIGSLKSVLGLAGTGSGTQSYKHMPMAQRAALSEGRWCYILLQGFPSSTQEAPHVMLAWPTCSITSSSDCLHTIYPDAYNAFHPRPFAPRRATSLQNLAASMRLKQELRAASSEQLAKVVEVEGALTLKRRVMKMEKGGRVPLIEGYRVDVRRWEDWMQAVGRGRGKVMMWMER
jgi:hypothetical protein